MPRKKILWGRVILYIALIGGSLGMAFPMIYALMGSLCDLEDFYRNPWFPIPTKLYLVNYAMFFGGKFLSQTPLWTWVLNSLIRIAWYITIPATVAVLAGYVFARRRFRGRDAAFMYLLSSMMVPGIVYWIPTYVMMARFPGAGGNDWAGQGGHGFVNAWPSLLIPGLVNVYFVFMLRQTYYSIPADFEEAARVDGAGTFRCLWDVYLPMLKPVLIVLVINQTVAMWNDYQWPLIVSSGNPQIWTVALGVQRVALSLAAFKGYPPGSAIVDYPASFAIATLVTVPMVVMFFLLQSYFVEGVQGFAIKG
jgi:multiple sugar transport system permease protein